ncbi:retinoic acid early-inducible protein 1-alpha-like [Peromyscus eremicus]|uniref:retinoic acid early-inducible protein 1-alpha-like n=1 Tax=Peromyscus eremicus TaxID=42410 RepID=UPI0027DE75EE|nr:retinoic acid early-inducible protein 1-alpha-like [Peromyscus eremicus]
MNGRQRLCIHLLCLQEFENKKCCELTQLDEEGMREKQECNCLLKKDLTGGLQVLACGEKLKPTATPTAAPDVDKASSMAIKPNISVLLIIHPYSVLLWFRGRILDNEDTHSLSCNVTVRVRPTSGQPRYEGLCSLDGEPFLQYDNVNKATPLGDLGKAVHDTQVWTDLIQRLEYLGQELRKMLADTKQETTDPSGHDTLQASMDSKYKQGHIIGASWRFNISGKYFFILNTMNMSRTPISPEARGIMNDEQFIKDLKVISTADSSHWLKELLKHQKEKPDRNQQQPMNCSINCYKPQRKERLMEPNGGGPFL